MASLQVEGIFKIGGRHTFQLKSTHILVEGFLCTLGVNYDVIGPKVKFLPCPYTNSLSSPFQFSCT
jgi:hypothetical protein